MAKDKVARKLTTIMAADVVGYSRLMGADEEATARTFKIYRQAIDGLIAKHEGRVFGGAGDSVIAEFQSPVEAVRCAVAFQREIEKRNAKLEEARRMRFRMGVNLGDVMIEGDDLLGDGVNVAARLEALAEPGGICISGSVFTQVKGKLKMGFADLGAQKVKNIAEPVPTYRVLLDPAVAGSVIPPKRKIPARWRWVAGVTAAVLVLVVAGLAWWRPWVPTGGPPGIAKRLSIVVLPFKNLSGHTKQDYFADAITEDLISDLSRIRGAFVIARGTSFTYKGKAVNAKTVAQQLKVRYVLEGSVRRSGDQVRINAQLIDGKSGAHVWSAKFDRAFKNVFALQSAITGRIAAVLRAELLEAESRRPKPANLKAWDFAVRGQVMLHRVRLGPNVLSDAKKLFETALKLNPNTALAWEGLAFIHFAAATREIPGVSVPNSSELALKSAQKAVSLDPRRSNAHVVLGQAFFWKGQGARALAACERALALNRNNDEAHVCAAQANIVLGRFAESIRLIEKAQLLNPRFRAWRRNFYIGINRFFLGEYQNAVIALNKAKADFPRQQSVQLYLAASLAMVGRADDARTVLATYTKLARGKRNTIAKLRADRGRVIPDFERFAEALRRAGMPER
ncbi:MAG: adenylate/guanylate cyclase domain-containing protein [Paracoccaceae bacterium]